MYVVYEVEKILVLEMQNKMEMEVDNASILTPLMANPLSKSNIIFTSV